MGLVFFKRALRELAAGKARYIALSLLIVFSIFIVVSLMGAAITVTEQTKIRDEELALEDGEFSVFVPLKESEIREITDRGVTLEKMFYLDYALNDTQVLRLFKVRENINRISVIEGCLPQDADGAVLERRFAEVNGYNVGDRITLNGREFKISGIGAVPDYNAPYRKISDTVVDSAAFGLMFVEPEMYDEMMADGGSINSEEYCYAFRLNGAMTSEDLEKILEDIKFDAEEVEDEFFLEYWDKLTGRKNELLEGIDDLTDGASDLADGAAELADGAHELSDGINEFSDGMTELHDAMPDLYGGARSLASGASSLESGIKSYTSGVDSAASGASELASGASALASGTNDLQTGAGEFGDGLDEYDNTVNSMTTSEDPTVAYVASQLASGSSSLNKVYDSVLQGIGGVRSGASALSDGAGSLNSGMQALSRNSSSLMSGASALASGSREMRDGIREVRNGVNELYDGSQEINSGAGELADGAGELADGAREMADGVQEFSDKANDLIDEVFNIDTSNLTMFIDRASNSRIDAASDDVQINLIASAIFGVLLVVLFAYVISVFIVHSIDKESEVIGALYSVGVKRRTLTLSYVAVPVIVSFVSGIIGTLIALYTPIGIPAQLADTLGYFSMPVMDTTISPSLYVYGLLIPPVTAFIVNVIVIRSRLKRSPLSLLKNERKVARGRTLKVFKQLKFINMFRLRQMIRELRSGFTVIFGMFMSLTVALLALTTYIYCARVQKYYVEQTNFEYMYNYKYPTEDAPEGGYEAVAESLQKEFGDYKFDITLLGVTEDNPFFGLGDLPDNDTDVILSSAVAIKYGLNEGDEFTLENKSGDRLYAFRVVRIVDFSASMFIFMDIDRVRDIFNESSEYYNVVFSDHELDIDSGRLFSVLSKSDIERSAGVYVSMMMPMIYTMTSGAAVIFVVVMFLMLNMMLDRSSFNIALVKIFGFRNKEVRKMYLDGNMITVAVGALICIPLSKMLMNYIYPTYLVANVGVGISQEFPLSVYAAIFAVIMGLYLVINAVLTGKIRRMVPAEVLKNRE